jgi:hypothetical protein
MKKRRGRHNMKTDRQKAAPVRKQRGEKRRGQEAAGHDAEENCRCKEVSKKSLPELLKVAIGDLTFWKKWK